MHAGTAAGGRIRSGVQPEATRGDMTYTSHPADWAAATREFFSCIERARRRPHLNA